MARNPLWTRDELILALDLYFRVNPGRASANHTEIRKLSKLLNALPVHAERVDEAVFRNPNGVYMKLCNFLRLDPEYKGKGLQRGGKLEESIWQEFGADRERLRQTAMMIRRSYSSVTPDQVASATDDEEFPEGRILTTLHKRRERNPNLVRRKKAAMLSASRRLACEVCGFDFEQRYGELGSGFAECHHRIPLSELTSSRTMRLEDLAIVCANCHCMLHRARPMLSIQGLQLRCSAGS